VPAAESDLTKPEQRLCDAIHTGTLVDFRTGTPKQDPPATGHRWGAERSIRAELIYDLLTGTNPSGLRPRALRRRSARITGTLDLEAMTILCPVVLRDCYLDQPIILAEHAHPPSAYPAHSLTREGADMASTVSS
jgi:hypothetical protein